MVSADTKNYWYRLIRKVLLLVLIGISLSIKNLSVVPCSEKSSDKDRYTDEDIEIIKILAPLTDNPDILTDNPEFNYGPTSIGVAAWYGNAEIVKILAPLSDNLNIKDEFGETAIVHAAKRGHIEVVKILAPLTDNLNVPNKFGESTIDQAASYAHICGHTEIVKILAPLTKQF